MKNLSLSLSFILSMIFNCTAQTPSGFTQPSVVSVCNSNGLFKVQNIAPPTGGWPSIPFTFSLEVFVAPPNSPFNPSLISNSANGFPDCIPGIGGNNPVSILNTKIGDNTKFSISPPTWNNTTNRFDFTITKFPQTLSSIPIEFIQFDLRLDCSLIPELISNGNNCLIQKWYYSGNAAFLPSQFIPVQFPNIIEAPIGQQFVTLNTPVNNSVQDWYFSYKNIGNTVANISITDFETEMCFNQIGGNNYSLISGNPILFQVTNSITPPSNWSGSNVFSFPSVVNISIPSQEYLHFRQQVNILGCMSACNGVGATPPLHVNFSWNCANFPTPPSCDNCQELYSKQLNFNAGTSKYEIKRILPTDPVALNNPECQGGSTSWQYEVKNTGDAILKDVSIRVAYPNFTGLSFISDNSVTVNYNCQNPGNCFTKSTIAYSGIIPDLCTPLPSNLVKEFTIHLFDLEPNQTCTFNFSTVNAASDDPLLYNTSKYFNQWTLYSVATTACSTIIAPDYTNSQNGINIGISGYSTSISNTTDDLNLLTTLVGNPSHTTVYAPAGSGPSTWAATPLFYSMSFDGLFGDDNDQQALGGNVASNLQISGFLKVEIECDEGLGIGNPNNISLAFSGGSIPSQVYPYAYEASVFNCGTYSSTPNSVPKFVNFIPVSVFPSLNCNCGPKTYTVYFRLSELDNILPPGTNRDYFFLNGNLTFGFDACCPVELSPSEYKIRISLLPNENCFDLINGSCTPLTSPATCCWLPLSETTREIFVHCPGCLAPGIIIDDYVIKRTSLGYPDADDNSKADISTPITYLPNQLAQTSTYSQYGQLKLDFSTYGDQLEDYLIAHLQNGENDPTFGGYEYSDLINNSIDLDILQLYRQFPLSDANHYDVQVVGIDLFIDDPATSYSSYPCLEEQEFQFQPNPLHTILKFSVDISSPAFSSFYSKSGSEMMFTFDRSMLKMANLPTGITRVLPTNNLNDVDFRVDQIYRIRVRYKVCGNPAPQAIGKEDESSISDILFLTGDAKSLPVVVNQMPNIVCDVCINASAFFPALACSTCTGAQAVSQTNLGDPYWFYCEGGGSDHYFISTKCSNYTVYGLDQSNSVSNCVGAVDMRTLVSFDKNMGPPLTNKFFEYEYKTPKLFQRILTLQEPLNWDWLLNPTNVEVTLQSYSCNNFVSCVNGISSSYNLSVPPAQTLNIDLNNPSLTIPPLTFNCIEQSSPINSPFIADELSAQRIVFKVTPESCGSAVTTEPSSAAMVNFSNNSNPCSEPLSLAQNCSFTTDKDNSIATIPQRTLPIPNPNITFNIIPTNYSVSTGVIIWEFDFTNEATTLNPSPTEARNVYLNIGTSLPGNNLQGSWEVDYILIPVTQPIPVLTPGVQYGTLISNPATSGYFWLTPNTINNVQQNKLAVGYRLHGFLTFRFNDCSQLSNTHDFIGGWNCEFTSDTPQPLSLCGYNVETVTFGSIQGDLTAVPNLNSSTYTPCSTTPITLSAEFINMGATELVPLNLSINPLPGSIVQLIGNPTILNNACQGVTGPFYSVSSSGSNSWNITNSASSDFLSQGECFTVQFQITTNGCHFGPLDMPVVTVTGEDFCGNPFDCSNSIPPLLASGSTNCTDCYSITKTATPGPAIVGDPYIWNIEICANNVPPPPPAVDYTVDINESYPTNFIPINPSGTSIQVNNIPAQGCTTITVLGAFDDVGECTTVINSVNLASNTAITSSACVDVVCPSPDYDVSIDTDMNLSTSGITLPNASGLKIRVEDYVTLTIDQNINFAHCEFYMGSGSQIVVESQVMLSLDKSIISSCPYMWKGIHLNHAAQLNVYDVTIRDAEHAIYAQHDAVIKLQDSRIYDCVIGVITEPSSTNNLQTYFGTIYGTEFGKTGLILKKEYPSYNGQPAQPLHGKIGRAGILLNDAFFNIGDNAKDPNSFFNINYGIETHNSSINIYNCAFRDIVADAAYGNWSVNPAMNPWGCGVYAKGSDRINFVNVFPLASGNVTIENAPVGIYTNQMNAKISGLEMENVVSGVNCTYSQLRSVSVYGCKIHARFRGIDFNENHNANYVSAGGNEIYLEPLPNTGRNQACIYLRESQMGNDANYDISGNWRLETNSGEAGIVALNVENANIGYNSVYTKESIKRPAPACADIAILGGGRNSIHCNSVMNTIPHSNILTKGMMMNVSKNNKIECNQFGSSQNSIGPYTGMWFGGDCDVSNNIAGNSMRNCVTGLYLNSAARIGAQVHRGNTWQNPQIGNTTAINANTQNFNYLNSRITVNINSGVQYWPSTISPPQWFDLIPTGSTFNACGTQTCIAAVAGGGGDVDHLKMVARDSSISFDYKDETRNQAQTNLYALLKEDSLLRLSDSIFQHFYSNKQSLAIGQLEEVKDDLRNAEAYTPQQLATLQLADSLIQLKTDSLNVLDSLHHLSSVSGYEATRQSIVERINILGSTVATIQQQHAVSSGILREVAALRNTPIVPLELPESNQKGMNDLFIQYKENGISSVSDNYNTLLAIAQQCPFAGGPAVYQARAMLELVDATVMYDDDAVCLQSGIYRIMQEDVSEAPELLDFKLIPNPAAQQVSVDLNYINEEPVNFEIRNVLGGLIKEFVIDKGLKSIVFSVNNFQQGIYFVRVRKDGVTLNAKRLIIIK